MARHGDRIGHTGEHDRDRPRFPLQFGGDWSRHRHDHVGLQFQQLVRQRQISIPQAVEIRVEGPVSFLASTTKQGEPERLWGIGDIVGVLNAWEAAPVRRSIWEEGHGMV